MGLGIDKIIELENNLKYLLTKKTMYQGSKYYLASKMDNKNNIDTNSNVIFKESMSGTEVYVTEISPKDDLNETLNRIFEAQV